MFSESRYKKTCKELEKIIADSGEPLEGNCVYKHMTLDPWNILESKRKNFEILSQNKNRICEIGFNAGHSILVMILSNPEAEYVLFDIGVHKYAKPCFEYIKKIFDKVKIKMFWGDSTITLPEYIENHHEIFDLIHIDGSHLSKIYEQDWKNSMELLSRGGIIIFDDTDNSKINNFVNSKISEKEVAEKTDVLETFGYKHRVLIKL